MVCHKFVGKQSNRWRELMEFDVRTSQIPTASAGRRLTMLQSQSETSTADTRRLNF